MPVKHRNGSSSILFIMNSCLSQQEKPWKIALKLLWMLSEFDDNAFIFLFIFDRYPYAIDTFVSTNVFVFDWQIQLCGDC